MALLGQLMDGYSIATSDAPQQVEVEVEAATFRLTNSSEPEERRISSTEQIVASNKDPVESPTQSNWRKHLVDCSQVAPEGRYVTTKTKPSFSMNIHDPKIDGVSEAIETHGCFECPHIDDLSKALKAHPDAWFLDIGTNIGMWTLSAAAMGRDTYSFEPFPMNWERVCRSINRNDFQNRTHLLNVAATSAPANLTFNLPESTNFGSVQVSEAKDDGGDQLRVAGIPLDSVDLPIDRPVAIKIDVEGGEIGALMGGLEFLRRSNIIHFAMELRQPLLRNMRPETKMIAQILQTKGLIPFRLDYENITELDPDAMPRWKHFKHPIVRYFDVVWRKP